ncbi:MAG: tRNA (adenosine(37)-N6)-dimethylallyltransferase MiaA, partial [Pseudolactococcus laudensis]
RRYSKRQITWFKNRMAVDFQDILAPDFKEQVERKIERFLDDKN